MCSECFGDAEIFFQLLFGKRRQPKLSTEKIIEKAHQAGIEVYAGFREKSHRLVFECQNDKVGRKKVQTILPDGFVEMTKKNWRPRKGRGLQTFGYPQSMKGVNALKHLRIKDDVFIHYDGLPDRDAKVPLVQTWTVNLSKTFHEKFEILKVEDLNFQDKKDGEFHEDAINAFRASMEKLVGPEEVAKWPIKCCRMKEETVNRSLVFVGDQSRLQGFVHNEDVQEYFTISAEEKCFRAWSKPRGAWIPRYQKFEWSSSGDEKTVLYTREGRSDMTSIMKRSQFDIDKKLEERVTKKEQTHRSKVEVPSQFAEFVAYSPLSINEVLGFGSFSAVLLVQKGAHQFALKMVKKEEGEHVNETEIKMCRFLAKNPHPFFVKPFVDFKLPQGALWETAQGEPVKDPFQKVVLSYDSAILLEHIEGGTLWETIEREQDKGEEGRTDRLTKYRRWAAEIVEAMSLLSQLQIVYRDLKPDNIMLKPMPNREGTFFVCLIDWSFAKFLDEASMKTRVSENKMFAAPELLKAAEEPDAPQPKYTKHIDVFSFGRTLKAMVACTTSPTIIKGTVFPPWVPETAKALVLRTTSESPEERGLFPDIKRDPFFGAKAFGEETPLSAIDFKQLVDDATST